MFDCLTWGSRPPASGRLAARRRSKISHTGPVDLWRGGWAHGVWEASAGSAGLQPGGCCNRVVGGSRMACALCLAVPGACFWGRGGTVCMG